MTLLKYSSRRLLSKPTHRYTPAVAVSSMQFSTAIGTLNFVSQFRCRNRRVADTRTYWTVYEISRNLFPGKQGRSARRPDWYNRQRRRFSLPRRYDLFRKRGRQRALGSSQSTTCAQVVDALGSLTTRRCIPVGVF